jgi:hypothetical protein
VEILKILVKGDTNDADYVTEITDIDQEELESIRPIVKAIQDCKSEYNWECDHYDSPKLEELYPQFVESWKETEYGKYPVFTGAFELFRGCCPSGGDLGIHSIESVTVYHVTKEEDLL